MIFAEFEQLPDPAAGRYELRHGEPIHVAPPKFDHYMIQQILRDLLDQAAAGAGRAYTETGFKVGDYEFRIADVAYATIERWARARAEEYFHGAPDLVIEVLSPSNTVAEMIDKETLCLENGCREFWLVDPVRRQVRVSTLDGRTITYKSGQQIPPFFGGWLAVDAIFS